MKRIINGRKYDTETAEAVGSWDNGCGYSDFHYCTETLHKKKTGEFFLYGEGNAASKYARSCGQNEWCGGNKIIPLSYEAAQKWAEEHLGGDEYEAIFGPVPEDDSKTGLNVRLSVSAYETIKREAAKAGINPGEYVEKLVKEANP